ncbi:MAG: glycosyl transferase group 1 [Solirubrobacterales bacterium]|nr:glycosyl transferase group 1 [Solirubrobacterales bacterium]
MRICIVYDCLFPWTVGGAERWYRNLAERLAAHGHEVTYLTLRQWEAGDEPGLPGVSVRAVGPRLALYGRDGRRRVLPPLVFGAGVAWHLLRHGRRYDVVHTASFPYFSLLAAGLLRPLGRFGLVVDWHEVWSRRYWREYLGRVGGAIGHAVQLACVRLPQRAFCFSRLHRDRLVGEGLRGTPRILEGEYAGDLTPPEPNAAGPVVVFAGRLIPEKRAPAVVPAVGRARQALPGLRATVFGDGPERDDVLAAIAREGLEGVVRAPGFVAATEVEDALRTALCMLLPSRREGYGLIVVEAAARGTPSIVVAGEDNAAVELVEEGVNGTVAASASPDDLAAAIVRVHEGGHALRERTCAWFAANARRLSLDGSLDAVVAGYDEREPSARS